MRHGETEWNAVGLVCGQADVLLTSRGQDQARSLRSFLAGQRFDSVWSSDLSRAVATARLAWGEPTADPRLRELDFGLLEGCVWDELDPVPKQALLAFDGFFAPEGESVEDFRSRVHSILDELRPGRHLLFVHAGLVRMLLREAGDDRFLPPSSVVGLNWGERRVLFIHAGPPSRG